MNTRNSLGIVEVGTSADVLRLRRATRAFLAIKADAIDVTHPALTAHERDRWNKRLTFLARVCGCQPGAVAAIAAIIACLTDPPIELQSWLGTALANIGFVVLVSITGKCIAVLAARVLIQFELQRLIRIMSGGTVRSAEG